MIILSIPLLSTEETHTSTPQSSSSNHAYSCLYRLNSTDALHLPANL